ncbi:MAG: hypothetical protein JNL42_14370 [Anaerolineae bacterium]|nr:hypothetical protein [Anaerolineae bacterium]
MFDRTPLMSRSGAWLLLALLLIAALPAAAQEGSGQLWVRAFVDRDGDGVRDPNEPLLTEGVAVELIREGVVIDSARLTADSPYTSQGLVGFQRLEPGEYTVRITAGALTPTTPDSVTVQVSGSGLPPVVEFGGQPPAEPAAAGEQDGILAFAPQDPEVMHLVVSALGALIVAGLVAGFGFLIYLLVLAPRYRAALAQAKRAATTTGSMRAVTPPEAAKPSDRHP